MLLFNLLGGFKLHASRICGRCGMRKSAEDFNRHERTRGGDRSSWCKACVNAYNRGYYAANRGEMIRRAKVAYERQRDERPVEWMFERKRQRCAVDGVDFDLTPDDIVIPTHCPVLGIKLAPAGSGDTDASPSLDRFDPKLGYVRGNVFVISWRANRIKNDGTAEEHEIVAAWMRRMGAN